MKDDIAKYLTGFLGTPIEVGAVSALEMKRTGWLVNFYDLGAFEWKGRRRILAVAKAGQRYTPGGVAKQFATFREAVGVPLVFVPRELGPHDIPRLIAADVPFVAPGRGIFLPDAGLAVTRPNQPRVARETFSAPAQILTIGFLLGKWGPRLTLQEAVRATGYSMASLVHAFQEIAVFGCGERITEPGSRRIAVVFRPAAEVWERGRARFFNPCKRVAGALTAPIDAVPAGVDALARISELNADGPTTFALPLKGFAGLGLEEVSPETAPYRLELWHYPPTVLGDGAIDPVSLFLSLRDNPDDRVQIQLKRLEEGFKW